MMMHKSPPLRRELARRLIEHGYHTAEQLLLVNLATEFGTTRLFALQSIAFVHCLTLQVLS